MSRQKVIITFILLLAFIYVKGQDKIVTIQNDTISCKIISISLKFIKYEQIEYNQVKESKMIPMNQVQGYSFGSRSQKSLSATYSGEQSTKYFSYFPMREQWAEPFEQWRIGFQNEGY